MSEPDMSKRSPRTYNPHRRDRGEPAYFNAIFTMECGHTRRQTPPRPEVGSLSWCPSCGDLRVVTQSPEEWSVRCLSCAYARQYGMARLAASHGIDAHLRRKPEHRTALYKGGEQVEIRQLAPRPTLMDAQLPDDPPF